jgi:hypothetical protein
MITDDSYMTVRNIVNALQIVLSLSLLAKAQHLRKAEPSRHLELLRDLVCRHSQRRRSHQNHSLQQMSRLI